MSSRYNFSCTRGDTLQTITFTVIRNGAPLDLESATIEMDWVTRLTGDVGQAFSLASGITITDAANGEFTIGDVLVTAPAGRYSYDIQFTLNTGEVKTYISGSVLIRQDHTT